MEQECILVAKYPERYFSVNQYDNLDNMDAHYETTGKEIWEQTGGAVTHFVMAGSTGGTIMGVGKFLKERKPDVRIILSDPAKSRLAGLWQQQSDSSKGEAALQTVQELIKSQGGGVKIEGAGKEALTRIMMEGGVLPVVDAAIAVDDFDAFDECRSVAAKSGILIGGSAGLNVAAAKIVAEQCAKQPPREGGVRIVTMLCDHGIKYMSKIYNDDWMAKNDTRRK